MAEKFILCVRYDEKLSLENKALGAFKEFNSVCSQCNEKVMLTQGSKNLLDADKSIKLLCQVCAESKLAQEGRPQYAVTMEHLQEASRFLQLRNAQKN